ncbi:MAG: ABC transporter permease [Methanoregula sp.]|jgi:putative ABC transport system permease protein|nr:ABC transporter permease [Methanoregula sp.]
MIFWEIAKRNIRVHFLRSALAMLGIVIGVVAIVSMGILGNAMVAMVSETISSVGDSVVVYPYFGSTGMGGGSTANLKITDQQFQQIKRVVAPNVAIPVQSTSERMKIGVGGDDIIASVYGVDPQYIPDLHFELESGSNNNANSGCMVGSTFAKDNNIKVGSRISIGSDGSRGTLRVTGIIKQRGMSFDISTDNAVVVTQSWFENTYDRNDYDNVVVKVKQGQDSAALTSLIEKQMNKRDKVVMAMDSKVVLGAINDMVGQVTTFVVAIGGISMIVAGFSIFNIMMMSVSERIKEIGIMRSIGTQKKEVMSMFVYEAVIIGVIGSAIGGVMSLLGGYVINIYMFNSTNYLFTIPNAISIAEGVTFGIVVCLACGIYPAWKAANMNPIDALRHE